MAPSGVGKVERGDLLKGHVEGHFEGHFEGHVEGHVEGVGTLRVKVV